MIPLTPEQMLALAKDSIKQAQEELKDYPDIPEHPGTFLIHSNVEPQGIYSEIDMELEARLKRSDTFAKRKNVLDQAMYAHVRNEVMTKGKELRDKITEISKKHRVLTRAARLAKNPEARNYLINEANKLKESPEIKDYSLLIEGLEAHSGVISSTISVACFDAYERHLNYLLPESVKHGSESYAKNDRINIEMRSMDDVMDDVKASLPGAKDKTPEELSKMYPNYSAFEKVVSPYAISSCRDTLDSYFKTLDDRLDMIIIDGETLRERMAKDHTIAKLTPQQLDNLSCEYVTAAIKSGADIEAAVHFYELGQASLYTDVFIPITGSEPRGKKERITLNFWERWMSKLGFYKEKAQKFEAQQKMDACRKKILDNIKNSPALSSKSLDDNNLKERMSRISAAENLYEDKKYIDTYVKNVRRKEILDGERIKLKYSFFPEKRGKVIFTEGSSKLPNMGRDVPTYLCIGYMLDKGISLEEAVDPSKHTDLRIEAGKWLTEAYNRQDPDEFDRIRARWLKLYADAVDKEAARFKNAFNSPEDIYNNYALLTGVAYACICNMDGLQNKTIGHEVLGSKEEYEKVTSKLSELESVYSVYNRSLDGSFERFQELIGPREIRIGSFISAQLHARSVLEGLKRTPPQFSPSFTMTDATTFSMIGESTQAKEYEATVENGNKEVIEDLLLTDGEKTLNMDLVVLDKPSINTKTMGALSPDMGFKLSYDVILNGESLYGLADPVTKKQIEISEPELDEFSM